MNVTIISCFRDATHYLERYCEQMDDLQAALTKRGDRLHLLLGYGDSTDGTGESLFDECANRFDAHLMDVSHGGPVFNSVEAPQRFKQLACIGNKLLGCVPPDADVVGIVESDLIWKAQVLLDLIAHTATYPAIAPMIFDQSPPDRFRDVYAFRCGGVRFTNEAPYHADLNGEVLQVDSAGSVLFVRGEYARKARFTDGEVIVGFCNGIREYGGSIWCDPTLTVQHPIYA